MNHAEETPVLVHLVRRIQDRDLAFRAACLLRACRNELDFQIVKASKGVHEGNQLIDFRFRGPVNQHFLHADCYREISLAVVAVVGKLFIEVLGDKQVNPLTVLAGVVGDRDMSQPSAKHVDHPFSFNAADLIFDGDVTEPEEGDTLEQTVGGVTSVYVLARPLDGNTPWRYATGFETGSEARILWNGRLKSVT